MTRNTIFTAAFTVIALASPTSGQDRAIQIAIDREGDVRVMTDLVVKNPGSDRVTESLFAARAIDLQALDPATAKPLVTQVAGGAVTVQWGRPLPQRAEQRITLVQRVPRGTFVTDTAPALEFAAELPPARIAILLPPGFAVDSCSPAAQVVDSGGRTKVGFVNMAQSSIHARIHATRADINGASISTMFRAEDERSIVYWLDDPAAHRVKLALELFITKPGQAHAFSVLRKDDHISDPVSLDVDRGVELKTRIMSGDEANAIGDSPTPFPPEAAVLVADLGYAVPPGGSARVRLYQTATDTKGYRLDASGALVWDRFLARLRTRAVLPPGWVLGSTTHPAEAHRDDEGRVALDFTQTAGDSPSIVVTGVRAAAR